MAVPKIRFPGFTDDWGQHKLKDEAFEIVAGGDVEKSKVVENGKYPIYANALTDDGIIGYYNDYYRIAAPAVTVTGRGDVGHAKARLIDFTPVVRLLAVKSKHNVYFLENSINNHKVIQESTGVPQLTVPQLGNYYLYFPPTIEEEDAIGLFIQKVDLIITLKQRNLGSMKLLKKSLLQKMFPKNGESLPEIRFPGFTDAWEQCKLGQIIEVKPFKPYIAEANNTGKHPVIQQGDNPLLGYSDRNDPFNDYKSVTLFGDHTLSLFKPLEPFFVATDGVKILSSAMYGLFFYYLLDRYKPHSEGYKRHFSILKEQDCWITSQNEQEKIGNFFFNLDQAIILHQRKVESLQKLKKSLLQQMFV